MPRSASWVGSGLIAGVLSAGLLVIGTPMTGILVIGLAPAARAADCLQQIDGMMVQYDLPASAAMAGTQTSAYAAPPPPPSTPPVIEEPGSFPPRTPAGRPGAALLTGGEAAEPHASPGLPMNKDLSPTQRKQVQAVLHDARAADALRHEPECLDLVQKARAIIGKKG
jgi:hypothetical protein